MDYVAKHSVLCACFLVLRGGAQITAFERRNHVEQDLKLCTKGVRALRRSNPLDLPLLLYRENADRS